METRDFDDEVCINLGHLVVSLLKKWRSLLIWILIGGLLGGVWYGISPKNLVRSKEDAALIEQMKLAAMYRGQYEQQKDYVENSAFMKLNAGALYLGNAEYYISNCNDPEHLAVVFHSILTDEGIRSELCRILNISDETELEKMVDIRLNIHSETVVIGEVGLERIDIQEKGSLYVSAASENEDWTKEAIALLCSAVTETAEEQKAEQDFNIEQISQRIFFGRSQAFFDTQKAAFDKLEELKKAYYTIENGFSQAEYALYETYILSGKSEELPIVLFPSSPLKKPVLLAVVFAFLACAWYVVQYLLAPTVKTADEADCITRRTLLGFIDESAPAKCVIDRWLNDLETHCFPRAVTVEYAVEAIKKLGQAVVVYDEENAALDVLAKKLGNHLGLLSQNAQTMRSIQPDTQAVLLIKLNETSKMQIARETALCRQYGITLAGTILVK